MRDTPLSVALQVLGTAGLSLPCPAALCPLPALVLFTPQWACWSPLEPAGATAALALQTLGHQCTISAGGSLLVARWAPQWWYGADVSSHAESDQHQPSATVRAEHDEEYAQMR
ncbi:hypothetical protein TgHK011_003816 [Trichoderma gracile]|nr:hypothetical protein TgHK011_003816 [Trichoderma gracile]